LGVRIREKGVRRTATNVPDYGNWVGPGLLYFPGGIGIALLLLSLEFFLLIIGAAISLAVFCYFAYARYEFSPVGGDLQARIRTLVLNHLEWNGQGSSLDIGCGNGALTIAVAQRFPRTHVTGVDLWGGGWGYSRQRCESNAKIAGVADRVTFHQASAATLPFHEGSFDLVVSNLVFHEVRAVRDKRALLEEALRVVKKGGVFAFQDLFRIREAYGDLYDLLETLRNSGIERVEYLDTGTSDFIPRPLRLPFMVGTMGLLYGKK
jgi:ubiquinone/menaquinone biosynthesis C-methylase UbiE